MKIGMIVAMEEELHSIVQFVKDIHCHKIYDLEFIEGKIEEKEVILCKCGIGKVNAGRTTQILIDFYSVDWIINIGVAGGVSKDVSIGDIVIGEKLVQHDFDITKFGHEKGFITGVGKYLYSDKQLVEKFKNSFDSRTRVVVGTIASGDIFCTDTKMSLDIYQKFDADCVEMEGAAIAQVCFLCKIPFLVVRSISDVVSGNNEVDFDKFLHSSSLVVAEACLHVLKNN